MPKPLQFYIGQIIQFNPSNDTYAAIPGATAKVTGLDALPTYIRITWVNNALRNGQANGEYYPSDFNTKFKPLKPLLKKALKRGRITNLEYLELLSQKTLKKKP
jgi:hypothetical protein